MNNKQNSDPKIDNIEITNNSDIRLLKLLEKLGQPLSVKAYNGLRRMGINTLCDLLELPLNSLKRDRRISEKAKQEVIDFVHSLGYNFRDEFKRDLKVDSQTPLEMFIPKLPSRACLALKRGGINTLGDLLTKSTLQILEIKHIGEGMLQEIIDFVHSLGYTLIGEESIIDYDVQIRQQSQENDVIRGRIDSKKRVLLRYNKLVRQKQALEEEE